MNLEIKCEECTRGVHNSFDTDAWKNQLDGYGVTLSEIRLLLKDLPNLRNLELIFDCSWLEGEIKEVEAMLLQEKLKGTAFDLDKTWRLLDEELTKRRLNQNS